MGISSKMSSQPSFASFSFSDDRVGPDFRYSSMNSSLSLMAYTLRQTHIIKALNNAETPRSETSEATRLSTATNQAVHNVSSVPA